MASVQLAPFAGIAWGLVRRRMTWRPLLILLERGALGEEEGVRR